MCGIAGIISSQRGFVTRERLQRMSDSLIHRGPDGEGFFISDKDHFCTGLAHRRLAIIDLSEAAAQPFTYMDRYTIIHNGELYNYRELKSELVELGLHFKTETDTEVIAAAYHYYGENCLHKFDGMFAFAIWDDQQNFLFCARDRFGEKPFYYYYDEQEHTFLFASEMKALWAAGIERKPKLPCFLYFLSAGITVHPQFPELSFYEGILQLPPAHRLKYYPLKQNPEVSVYWDLDKETIPDISEKEASLHFIRLFENSIERRLRSDVPIGFSISGGLDSSSIVAVSANQYNTNELLSCFSAIFPGFDKDESEYIQSLSKRFALDTNFVSPDADGLLMQMNKLVYHQEEPFSSASIFAQYAVYEKAKEKNISVLLDGQGADEILAGYTKYTHWYLQERLAKKEFNAAKREALLLKDNGFLDQWGIKNYMASFFPGITAGALERKAQKVVDADPYINDNFRETYSGGGFIFKPVVEKLNDILYYDTCMGGLQSLLRYADRNAMAHGREVRLPFLQHELVSFIFSLPSNMKIRNGFTKWILRESYRSSLPENISYRKGKTGFEPPQKTWMQDEKIHTQIRIARQKLVDAGILKASVLKKPVQPTTAYDARNTDWLHWNASLFL